MTDSERSPEADAEASSGNGDANADPATLADRVENGELRLYELDDHADAETAATARRLAVERRTGVDLSATGDYAFAAEKARSNIENMVGGVQLPVGVAGPVAVHGEAADGDYHLPIATTEGALVASVNRGCSTITAAGGATARVTKRGMTRAPVFSVEDVAEGAEVIEWVRENEGRLAAVAEETTRFGELQEVTPYIVGDNVFLRFSYHTGDANGMNMATIATRPAAELVEAETPAVAPNLAAIAGPVLAARLIALAGGLESLARKPSGTVQVLGAEDALFAHLDGRGPSPKHGIIYIHEYVRGTRPEERGSAARALAGKLAIAARVDHYSGDRKTELDAELAARIDRIRSRGDA